MASTRQIKGRIRSVKSNKQITKAMEMVASSKLRHAQESALKSKQYSHAALEILNSLANLTDIKSHDLFKTRKIRSRTLVVITSDRGLAGAYNANALKILTKEITDDKANDVKTSVIAIGKKGAQLVTRLKDVEVLGVYNAGDKASQNDIRSVTATLIDKFKATETDKVDIIATEFVNSITQTPKQLTLLPVGHNILRTHHLTQTEKQITEAKFEPSMPIVLEYVVERLIEATLYQAMLDSVASEHAMRRVAMKNASDNASDIIDDLTLEMNKVRQAGITQELSEISAGVEAMK